MSAQLSENDELVLGPWGGLCAGTMLGGIVATVACPMAGVEIHWAAEWLPWALSALFGVLYGACQLRVPIRGLVAVGIFYGVFLWVLTNLVGWLAFPVSISAIRSWPGIGMFILFTASLGFLSVLITIAGGGKGTQQAEH